MCTKFNRHAYQWSQCSLTLHFLLDFSMWMVHFSLWLSLWLQSQNSLCLNLLFNRIEYFSKEQLKLALQYHWKLVFQELQKIKFPSHFLKLEALNSLQHQQARLTHKYVFKRGLLVTKQVCFNLWLLISRNDQSQLCHKVLDQLRSSIHKCLCKSMQLQKKYHLRV